MKVIDINLIGEYGKNKNAFKVKRSVLSKEKIDPKTRELSKMIAIVGCLFLALSLVSWGYVSYISQNKEAELKELKKTYQELEPELKKVSSQQKSSKIKKRILELKLVARDTINEKFISWHNILRDIASAVPREVQIKEITRVQGRGKNATGSNINIKGLINADKSGALRLVSYFVLNINSNTSNSSLLNNAVIDTIKFDEQTGLYDFSINVKVNKTAKVG